MTNIVAFIGPSGSGKSSLQTVMGIPKILSLTSRPPRPDESNGRDYIFKTREDIIERNNNGKLLEVTEYNGHLYATTKESVEELITKNITASIILDEHGVKMLRKQYPNRILVVGVYASLKDCRTRLEQRSNYAMKRLDSYRKKFSDCLQQVT
ncbi:guanylate kinase [Heliobacterium chlorum]|uniref:Guanylate kinase n=1 Tax=Heliobacterium chlorum TaxID=2698 RepID=A0ABR7T585_HELCL|nr:guanylate kinase [Heliobacterium chlorum]